VHPDQILDELTHLRRVGIQRRQRTDLDRRRGILDLDSRSDMTSVSNFSRSTVTKGAALVDTRET